MNEEVQFRRPELMPLSILRAIWKRKLAIIAMFLLLTVVSVVGVALIPPEYSAGALILIEQQRIPERIVTSTVNEGLESRLNRINNQVHAYDVLVGLIEEFNLYPEERASMAEEEVVEMMREHISVSLVAGLTANRGNTTAFRVSFSDASPDNVASVANRLANRFVDENKRSRTIAAEGTASFINTQIQDAQNSLSRAEQRLTQIRQQFMGELPEQEGAVVAEISRRQVEYQTAEAEVARAHQGKMFLENSLEAAVAALEIAQRGVNEQSESQPDSGTGQAPTALRSQLARATAEYEALKARYSETHPDVVRSESYVQELRASLAAAEAEATKVNEGTVESATLSPQNAGFLLQAETRVKQLRTQLLATDQDIKRAEARRETASAAFAAASAKMSRIPIHQQDLVGAQREYDTALARWMELSGKSFDANLAQTMEERESSERFTVIDPARFPAKPVWPPREAFAGGAALGSLAIACIFGFVLELKKNVVLGEWEMPAGMPVLGRIPVIVPESDMAGASAGRAGLGLGKRALLASSVLLSLAVMAVATSLYFGWISF